MQEEYKFKSNVCYWFYKQQEIYVLHLYISIGSCTYKINLFADGMLLFLSDPMHSLKELQNLLDDFAKRNQNKLVILPSYLLEAEEQIIAETYNYQWTKTRLKYLVIHLYAHKATYETTVTVAFIHLDRQ